MPCTLPDCLLPTTTSPKAWLWGRNFLRGNTQVLKKKIWILFSFKQEYLPHPHPIGFQETLMLCSPIPPPPQTTSLPYPPAPHATFPSLSGPSLPLRSYHQEVLHNVCHPS